MERSHQVTHLARDGVDELLHLSKTKSSRVVSFLLDIRMKLYSPRYPKKKKDQNPPMHELPREWTKRKTSEGGKVSADETARHGPPSEPALSSPRRECHRLAPRLTAAAV